MAVDGLNLREKAKGQSEAEEYTRCMLRAKDLDDAVRMAMLNRDANAEAIRKLESALLSCTGRNIPTKVYLTEEGAQEYAVIVQHETRVLFEKVETH